MIAYLINPEDRTISQVTVNDYTDISKHIGCDMFCIGGHLPSKDVVFVDDEGLLKDPSHFFAIDSHVIKFTNPNPLAGKGLVLGGTYSGESADAVVSLSLLSAAVRWFVAETSNL